ncbi:MAG: hypothetical protein HZY76_08160 [Anaerolineae bacterium]|nr:MAG: hypothetical protein HZY76_08160 [Anaerolineae bacterium]
MALAEETAQEGMLQIWRKLDTYRHDGPFLAWATRIAVNKFRDRMRQEHPWQTNMTMDDAVESHVVVSFDPGLADVIKHGLSGLARRNGRSCPGGCSKSAAAKKSPTPCAFRGAMSASSTCARQKLRAYLEANGYLPP